MSPDIQHLPLYHRLREQYYRLKGSECANCGAKIFPPRPICPHCDYEVNGEFIGMGTVNLIYSHSGNGQNPRQIELQVSFQDKNLQVKINLLGRNHSIELKAGLQIPIFVRNSTNGGSPLYSSEVNQPASEATPNPGSSKFSK